MDPRMMEEEKKEEKPGDQEEEDKDDDEDINEMMENDQPIDVNFRKVDNGRARKMKIRDFIIKHQNMSQFRAAMSSVSLSQNNDGLCQRVQSSFGNDNESIKSEQMKNGSIGGDSNKS